MAAPAASPRSGFDCIVMGAGIIGVCAALDLQRRGARVALVDHCAPGSGASFGNAGIVVNTNLRPVFAGMTPLSFIRMLRNPASPLNVNWSRFPIMLPWFLHMLSHAGPAEVSRITRALASLCQPGADAYAGLWKEAGAHELVQAKGNVALHHSEAGLEAQWQALSQIREMGVAMERVGAADLRRLVPAVSEMYTHGLYSPTFQHTLDPQALVGRLFALFRSRGGAWFNEEVHQIEAGLDRITGVATSTGRIEGGAVLVACGTASARFAKAMGERVPHHSVGGYHAMLRNPAVILDRPVLPIDFRFAITPMAGGIRLAGIYEFGGEGRAPRKDLLANMLSHIGKVLPGISTDDVSVWRGFRSYLPDGLPLIDRSRTKHGLFYAFGFSSSGMINGAAAGRAVGALVCGATSDIDLSPFSISRFGRLLARSGR